MNRFLQPLLLAPLVASAGEFRELAGHERWVLALAVSPDGETLVSGSDDHTVRTWDLADPGRSRVLRRMESAVTALAFNRDGRQLAIGTYTGELLFCDPENGELLGELREHTETINALAFDPSGRYLASGSADDRLIVWDAATGDEILTMHQGSEYDVTTVAFSPDGQRLVTGDGENQLKVWDAESGDEIQTLTGHAEPVTAAVYLPDGLVVSGSWDATIRIWQRGGALSLTGHRADITSLAVSGNRILSASEDGTVRIWNADTGELQRTLGGGQGAFRSLAVSPDGGVLFAGGLRGIRAWMLEPG